MDNHGKSKKKLAHLRRHLGEREARLKRLKEVYVSRAATKKIILGLLVAVLTGYIIYSTL